MKNIKIICYTFYEKIVIISYVLGFTYKNKTYNYKKNAFDDIIGIYDSNYKEVCSYNYDAYGNILSIKDNNVKDITDTSNIAIINHLDIGHIIMIQIECMILLNGERMLSDLEPWLIILDLDYKKIIFYNLMLGMLIL